MASHIERRKFLATLGGTAAAWPLAARAQSDVQWLYHRVCANYSSNDAHAFCMTYINGVVDLMQKNCEIARQRLSAGGLSNADDRRAMLSVSSDARAVYVGTAGMMNAFMQKKIPSAGIYRWWKEIFMGHVASYSSPAPA